MAVSTGSVPPLFGDGGQGAAGIMAQVRILETDGDDCFPVSRPSGKKFSNSPVTVFISFTMRARVSGSRKRSNQASLPHRATKEA